MWRRFSENRAGDSATLERVHRAAVPLLLVAAALAPACRSLPKPGTGDLTFRVRWTGAADLDLYVTSPAEERVDFLHKEVPSGGTLDLDCNVTALKVRELAEGEPDVPEPEDGPPPVLEYEQRLCNPAIENIYWPRGRALQGKYEYSVFLANSAGAAAADTYRVQVLIAGRVHHEVRGSVLRLQEEPVLGEVEIPLPADP